jgi:hypothetical protein
MADLSQEIGIEPGRGGGRPWGDIYTVATPETDKAVQTLVQHQNQMDLVGARQRMLAQKALDLQRSKIGSNLRPADEEKFGQLYDDFKNASIDLQKNQNHLSTSDFLAAQSRVNDKLSAAKQWADESREQYQQEMAEAKKMATNPQSAYLYAPDAGAMLNARMVLPHDKLNNVVYKDTNGNQQTIDLTDLGGLHYKPNAPIQTYLNNALTGGANGTRQPINLTTFQDPSDPNANNPDAVSYRKLIPTGFANAAQVYPRLVGVGGMFMQDDNKNKVNKNDIQRSVLNQYAQVPEAEKQDVELRYQALANDKNYLAAHNLTALPQAPPGALSTDLGKAAWFLAQREQVNNPINYKTQDVPNLANKMYQAQVYALQKQDHAAANNLRTYQGRKDIDQNDAARNIQGVVDDIKKNAVPILDQSGTQYTGEKNLVLPSNVSKALELKDVPVLDANGKPAMSANDPNKPLTTNVQLKNAKLLKNGKIDKEYENGTHILATENTFKWDLISNPDFNTKFKINEALATGTKNVPLSSKHTSTNSGSNKVKLKW